MPAGAQSDIDEAKRRRDSESHKLTESDRVAREIQADVAAMRQEREKLNAQLLQTAKLIQASETQLSTIEARKQELEDQEKLLLGSLDSRRGSMSGLLAAMQRMGRNPPPVMITRREDALSMVRSAMLIGAAFPQLRAEAQALSDELKQIIEVKTKIDDEGTKLRAETQRLSDMRVSMTALLESKKQSLSERQEELAQVRRAAADISRSVSDLNELIGKLDRAVADNTRLGKYEKQLREEAQREKPKGAPPPPETSVAAGTAEPAMKAAEAGAAAAEAKATKQAAVAPEKSAKQTKSDAVPTVTIAPGDRLAMAAPGRIQPAIAFHLAKGRLPLPASGRRVLNFGDRTQRGKSEGVVIETRHGAQITAPNDGWVMYAGEFRSYGQILIINGGGGYHVLLAGLSHTDVLVGQFVLAGEPVGMMPAAPKTLQVKSQDNAPVLYVEFRKDQKPIDPEPWWADSAKKVQG